jgi:hypothetical protein
MCARAGLLIILCSEALGDIACTVICNECEGGICQWQCIIVSDNKIILLHSHRRVHKMCHNLSLNNAK